MICFVYCYNTDPEDPHRLTENTRRLGLVVCRGTQVSLLCPSDGMEEIANPFEDAGDEEADPAIEA